MKSLRKVPKKKFLSLIALLIIGVLYASHSRAQNSVRVTSAPIVQAATVVNSPANYESLSKYNALEVNTLYDSSAENPKISLALAAETAMTTDMPASTPTADENLVASAEQTFAKIQEKQSDSLRKVEDAMAKIENSLAVKSFVLGNSTGVVTYQLIQIKDQNYQLKKLMDNPNDTDALRTEIRARLDDGQQEKIKVENFIIKQQSKFSLFGWFVDLL